MIYIVDLYTMCDEKENEVLIRFLFFLSFKTEDLSDRLYYDLKLHSLGMMMDDLSRWFHNHAHNRLD
jgi:hypothetical protein